jgi:hypothetical protein
MPFFDTHETEGSRYSYTNQWEIVLYIHTLPTLPTHKRHTILSSSFHYSRRFKPSSVHIAVAIVAFGELYGDCTRGFWTTP